MGIDNAIGLVVAALVIVYLIVALVIPEKF